MDEPIADEPKDLRSLVDIMYILRCPFGGIGAYLVDMELCVSVCSVRNACREAKEELQKELERLKEKLDEGNMGDEWGRW